MTIGRRPGHDDLWRAHGACSSGIVVHLLGVVAVIPFDPDLWFPEQGSGAVGRRVCAVCPVRVDCLRYALDAKEEFGIWGGAGEHARRFLGRLAGQRLAIEMDDHFARLDEFAVTGAQPKGAAQVNGAGATHGKASTYGRGCRCVPCKAAKMASLARTAEKQRAASEAGPVPVAE